MHEQRDRSPKNLNSFNKTLGKIILELKVNGLENLSIYVRGFFLQLETIAIEDVNRFVDSDNMSYAKKARIRCGLALEVNDTLTTNQLFFLLQKIIAKYQPIFQGLEAP